MCRDMLIKTWLNYISHLPCIDLKIKKEKEKEKLYSDENSNKQFF